MSRTFAFVGGFAFAAVAAWAQANQGDGVSQPPSRSADDANSWVHIVPGRGMLNTPGNTAITGSNEERNRTAPLEGKSSYTESQARHRMESQGYTQVDHLILENGSLWRATGMREGRRFDLTLDYAGNVVGQSNPQ